MNKIKLNQRYLVLVEMPKRVHFQEWGTVGNVMAGSVEEAITKAVDLAPELTEFVPAGVQRFFAIPLKQVPLRQAVVGQTRGLEKGLVI